LTKEQWDVEKKKLIEKSLGYYNDKVAKNEELKAFLTRYNTQKKTQQNQNQDQ